MRWKLCILTHELRKNVEQVSAILTWVHVGSTALPKRGERRHDRAMRCHASKLIDTWTILKSMIPGSEILAATRARKTRISITRTQIIRKYQNQGLTNIWTTTNQPDDNKADLTWRSMSHFNNTMITGTIARHYNIATYRRHNIPMITWYDDQVSNNDKETSAWQMNPNIWARKRLVRLNDLLEVCLPIICKLLTKPTSWMTKHTEVLKIACLRHIYKKDSNSPLERGGSSTSGEKIDFPEIQ